MKKIFLILTMSLIFSVSIFSEQESYVIPNDKLSVLKGKNNTPFNGIIKKYKNIEFYKNGRPNGKWLKFYANGSLKAIENWKDGKLSGKYILYSSDETRILENNYKDGKDHGRYLMFHPNGNAYIKGAFYEGKPVGIWYYYSLEGKITGMNDFRKNNPK